MSNRTNDIIVPMTSEGIVPLASSGTIENAFRTGYKVQISWKINSQDISNNTSNVTVKAQLVSTGSGSIINSSATKNGTLTINGTQYSFTFTAGLTGNQTKTVYTKTVDIPHSSDGTKTLSMSASLGINVTLSGTYWGTVTVNGSGVLDAIPRTSSISLSETTATLGSTSVKITINRASSSFTHKVYCKIGSYSKTISTSATTSSEFTPEMAIANQIPNSTSGSATIEVQTYSGSTKIGSVTKTLKVKVPTSMVPTIGSFTATTVASGAPTSYGYVKGLSKCTLAMGNVAGAYGSTIESYSISGGGFSSTKSSFTTSVLNKSGNITFTATVTDSRGRTATKTVSITVHDYSLPSISKFSATRCNSSGVVSDDGTYLKVGATYSYSSVNSQNSVTVKIMYKKSTSSAWLEAGSVASGGTTTIGGNLIATDSSYDVKIVVTDKFNSTTKSLVIPTAYAIIDIRKGGKGLAFGKLAESDNVFDIGMSTLRVGASGSTLNCSTSAFTYKNNAIYHAGNKPTASDVGAYAKTQWSYSNTTSGYCKLPNGLILQWGVSSITPSGVSVVTSLTVAFPISFPNSCRFVNATPRTTVPDKIATSVSNVENSSFDLTMTRTNTTATTYNWFAVGY